MVAKTAEPKILHPREARAILGIEGSMLVSIASSGHVRPEIPAFNRTPNFWTTDGLTGMGTYCDLRKINIESSLALRAAGVAQQMARDAAGMIQSGRILMLILPDGTIKKSLTQEEAKEILGSLAECDLGRAIVVNVLHAHLEIVKRAKEYFEAREKAAAKR